MPIKLSLSRLLGELSTLSFYYGITPVNGSLLPPQTALFTVILVLVFEQASLQPPYLFFYKHLPINESDC